MRNGFQRIIETLPSNSQVLDVGAMGLGGENTTKYLWKRFGENVTCLNKEQIGHAIDIVADFYTYDFKEKYDVVVLDMKVKDNIEKDWTFDGFCRIFNLLSSKGIFITYLITDYQELEYQDFDISKLFDIFAIFPEGRRNNIVWVAFKKNV